MTSRKAHFKLEILMLQNDTSAAGIPSSAKLRGMITKMAAGAPP
jgi:hypothetical protein